MMITYSGHAPTRVASVRWLTSGTRASRMACCHTPPCAIRLPSGAMIVLSPVVEAYTTARSDSTARILAIAVCCWVSPSWPSISKSASLDCTASRLAPALTSDRTRWSKATS